MRVYRQSTIFTFIYWFFWTFGEFSSIFNKSVLRLITRNYALSVTGNRKNQFYVSVSVLKSENRTETEINDKLLCQNN